MGNMDQHPHSRGEYRSVGNHPVPSVEATVMGHRCGRCGFFTTDYWKLKSHLYGHDVQEESRP